MLTELLCWQHHPCLDTGSLCNVRLNAVPVDDPTVQVRLARHSLRLVHPFWVANVLGQEFGTTARHDSWTRSLGSRGWSTIWPLGHTVIGTQSRGPRAIRIGLICTLGSATAPRFDVACTVSNRIEQIPDVSRETSCTARHRLQRTATGDVRPIRTVAASRESLPASDIALRKGLAGEARPSPVVQHGVPSVPALIFRFPHRATVRAPCLNPFVVVH